MTRVAVLLLAGILAVVAADARQGAQAPSPPQGPAAPGPPPAGILAGKVIDAGTGAPIAEVTLTLSGGGLAPPGRGGAPGLGGPPPARRALTDAQGRFLFRDLPAGPFSLTASAGGYIQGGAGVMRPGGPGQPVPLPADGRVLDLVIKLFKYAAIAGTVTDEAGEPVVSVTMRAFKSDVVGGRRKLTAVNATFTTDDRGAYRIPQLMPGDYAIAFVASPISMPAEALVESERARTAGSAASAAFTRDLDASGANLFSQPGSAVGDWRLLYGTNARPPAAADDGQVLVYPTVFHAASISAQNATVVSVGSGEEKTGIDFQLRPARSARVSGVVMGPDGPVKFFGLRLIATDADQFASEMTLDPAVTMTTSTGAFTFLGISPGSYVLKAVKVPEPFGPLVSVSNVGPSGAQSTSLRPDGSVPSTLPSLWATVPVQVAGADLNNVVVTLKEGARVSGRVEFDGVAAPPAPDKLKQANVTLDPAASAAGSSTFNFFQQWRGQLSNAGTFTSSQLPPGRYFIRSSSPGAPWTLDAITANGHDVTDVAMDVASSDISDVVIRFTDKVSPLSGVVRNAQRQNDPTAVVLVFPIDPAMLTDYGNSPRRLRTVRTTNTGAFTVPSLPPGDYLVVAISDADSGAWPDPTLLGRLAAVGTHVTIERGQAKTQDLTTASVR